MSPVTFEAARQAARRVDQQRRYPLDGGSNADDYGIVFETASSATSEPGDPRRVDQELRRETRIAHESFSVGRLPDPLVECGCGECPSAADPLADGGEPFRDVLMAADECPEPRAMTVGRAREVYLRYERAAWKRPDRTGALERVRQQHGRLLGGERDVLKRYGGDATVLFLSLRVSPIAVVDGRRRWVEPVKLDQWLDDGWQRVYHRMYDQLSGFDWEYVGVTAATRSAATPHLHLLVYVRDPDSEVGIEVAQSLVESHVGGATNAYESDHPVEAGDRDAGMVFHDPPTAEMDDETALDVLRTRDGEGFPPSTPMLKYMATQRPHWVIEAVYDGESDTDADSVLVDGGAVAWAAPHDWLKSSSGFGV